MAMNRTSFEAQLQDGLNAVFGLQYDEFEKQWQKIFVTRDSQKAFEEMQLSYGLGGAVEKPEGGNITYDEGGEGYKARWNHVTIALAFAITEEALEDGLYGDLGDRYARALARSLYYTKEIRGANILNNAFDSSYTGGDGVELCGVHTMANGDTFQNELSTAADLSEEALEDMLIAMKGMVDDRGIPIVVQPDCLVIPRQLEFIAGRILNSIQRVGTANNDSNELRRKGSIPDTAVNVYLTDSDAFFLVNNTSIPEGLVNFNRRSMKKGIEGDFETGNVRYKASERYSFGWGDWRACFSSPGI